MSNLVKYKIRKDWQATRQGMLGGLNITEYNDMGNPYPTFGQRTEFSDIKEDTWENAVGEGRKLANQLLKNPHPYDGEYIQGIVVVEWKDDLRSFRRHSFTLQN